MDSVGSDTPSPDAKAKTIRTQRFARSSIDIAARIGCEFPQENAPVSVVFGPVWGLLLAMAIMFAVNPVLLAVIVLMISRPRA
ncbi:Uncharacterised protein [Mycobacteroides abscessus subsp. abscessus]|nr:Uncharacterised protein [Mycobacteroides abscessus subsp. abscessus]